MTKFLIILLLSISVTTCLISQNVCSTINSSIWDSAWQSCQTKANPNASRGNSHWIMYDLGKVYDLSSSWIWNVNKSGELNTGFKNIIVDHSLNQTSWTSLGSYEIEMATGASNYKGVVGPNFNNIRARYILITAIDNWGDVNCYGLTEMRFNLTEPNDVNEINTITPPTLYALELSTDGNGKASASILKPLYKEDEKVIISANANTGYQFSHWSGDVSGSQSPINVLIKSHMNVKANFVQEELLPCQDSELNPSGTIANGDYIASSKITSSGTVINTRIITFLAGDNIELLNGFQVDEGGVFNAMIGGCTE